MEVEFRLNQIAYDGRANVTSTATKLNSIFTVMNSITGIKRTIVQNFSDNNVYYGQANSVTTSTAGGLILSGSVTEFSIPDRNSYPFFVSGPDSSIGVVVFS